MVISAVRGLARFSTRWVVASAGALASTLSGCATPARPGPDLAALYDRPGQAIGPDRTPVVVIPGILGSRLVNRETGQVIWGAFTYGAADPDYAEGARAFALPLAGGRALGEVRDSVETDGVLDAVEADVGPLRVTALEPYRGIILSLAAGRFVDRDVATGGSARRDERGGRAVGTGAGAGVGAGVAGGPVDYAGQHFTCFQFDYDWRRDLSEHAERLDAMVKGAARLAQAARGEARSGELPRVDVVAHSMGGLVLMYYLRFGAQPLPEDGSVPRVTWEGAKQVRHAVLVGTPSAGSVLALRQLIEGVNYSPITPTYQPAVLGTMPAIYQLMTRVRHARVVESGSGAAVNIYDAETWRRHGWGLCAPSQREYLAWLLPGVADAGERDRVAFEHLSKCLARAAQLHAALDQPAPPLPAGCEIRLFAGDADATADVLEVEAGTGRVRIAATSPGDGTVTRASALLDERVGKAWAPGLRSPVPWAGVNFLPHDHIDLTASPVFTDNLLFLLLETR